MSGLLDPQQVDSTNYFGGTKMRDGKMVKFVKKDLAGLSSVDKPKLQAIIAALSAEAGLKSQRAAEAKETEIIGLGREAIRASSFRCTECHLFGKADEDATAPDLTGWGSRAWLISFLSDPSHPRFYGKKNDRMPRFGKDQVLDEAAIGLIADWLRGDWYEPTLMSGKTSHDTTR